MFLFSSIVLSRMSFLDISIGSTFGSSGGYWGGGFGGFDGRSFLFPFVSNALYFLVCWLSFGRGARFLSAFLLVF